MIGCAHLVTTGQAATSLPSYTLCVYRVTLSDKFLLKGVARIFKLVFLIILCEEVSHPIAGFLEVICHDFDDRKDGSLVEVGDKLLDLLAGRQVVTPGKDV